MKTHYILIFLVAQSLVARNIKSLEGQDLITKIVGYFNVNGGKSEDDFLQTMEMEEKFSINKPEEDLTASSVFFSRLPNEVVSNNQNLSFTDKVNLMRSGFFEDEDIKNETNEEIKARGNNWYKNVRFDNLVPFYYTTQPIDKNICKNSLLKNLEQDPAFNDFEKFDSFYDEKSKNEFIFHLNYKKTEDANIKNVIGQLVRFMIITNSLNMLKNEKNMAPFNFSAENIVFGSNVNKNQLNFPVITNLFNLKEYDASFTESNVIESLANFFLFRLGGDLETLKDVKYLEDLPIGEIYYQLINDMKNGEVATLIDVRNKLKNEIFPKINDLTVFVPEENEEECAYDTKFTEDGDIRYKASYKNFLKMTFTKVKNDANDFFKIMNNYLNKNDTLTVEDFNIIVFNQVMTSVKITQAHIYQKIMKEFDEVLQNQNII